VGICQSALPGLGGETTGVPKGKIIEAARLYATTKPAALMTSASATPITSTAFRTTGPSYCCRPDRQLRYARRKLGGALNLYHVFSGAPTNEKGIRLADRMKDLPPRMGEDRSPSGLAIRPGGSGSPVHDGPVPDPVREALPSQKPSSVSALTTGCGRVQIFSRNPFNSSTSW